jgi:hypothetical protein
MDSLSVHSIAPPSCSRRGGAVHKGGLGSILRATTRARRSSGRKRHILVDTLSLLLNVIVHPVNIFKIVMALPPVTPRAPTVPVHRKYLCRRWLRRCKDGAGRLARGSGEVADRKAIRYRRASKSYLKDGKFLFSGMCDLVRWTRKGHEAIEVHGGADCLHPAAG